MPVLTYTQQLESVQAAIAAIEGGNQAYRLETGVGTGRSVTRADLETLYKREERLIPLAQREANASTGIPVRFGTAL